MLSVATLGTGTAFPEAGRGPTCQLLRHRADTVVVDLGSGSLQKLAAAGVLPIDMGALLLTHAHLDHIADLFPMVFALRVPLYDRARPLPIYASQGTLEIVQRVSAAWGRWLDIGPDTVVWHAVRPGEVLEVGGLMVEVGTVEHDASSVGYRFTTPGGRALAIPGDSGVCDGLVELCRDAELAVLELSMPRMCPSPTHLDPAGLAAVVERSGLRRLAVVHRYPAALANDALEELREAVRKVDASVVIVAPGDGEVFEVGP